MTRTLNALQKAEAVIVDLIGLSSALEILTQEYVVQTITDLHDRKCREGIIGVSDAIARVIESHNQSEG
jgi:hypothetical protein